VKHRRRRTVFPGERNLRCPDNGNQSGDSRSRFSAAKILDSDVGAIDLQINLGLKPFKFLETNSQKPMAGIPFVEQELAAIVCPARDPVSQGSRWSPPGLASRYLVNGEINAG